MLTVDSLKVEFSGRTLFSDVSFSVNENDKIALMGKNGAGKSTLLKLLAGTNKPSGGTISAPKDYVVAYLPQHLLTEDNATVFEETSKAFAGIFAMRDEIEALNQQLTSRTDYDSDDYYKEWSFCAPILPVRLPNSAVDGACGSNWPKFFCKNPI